MQLVLQHWQQDPFLCLQEAGALSFCVFVPSPDGAGFAGDIQGVLAFEPAGTDRPSMCMSSLVQSSKSSLVLVVSLLFQGRWRNAGEKEECQRN